MDEEKLSYELIRQQSAAAVTELLSKASFEEGDIFVVGCSSSEIKGEHIGKGSDIDAAKAVLEGIYHRKRSVKACGSKRIGTQHGDMQCGSFRSCGRLFCKRLFPHGKRTRFGGAYTSGGRYGYRQYSYRYAP